MAKTKDRSNTYWLNRLERDHPAIFAKFRSGLIPSVRAARCEAGLLRQPTRLEKIMRDWKRLSLKQRKEFLRSIKVIDKVASESKAQVKTEGKSVAQLKFF